MDYSKAGISVLASAIQIGEITWEQVPQNKIDDVKKALNYLNWFSNYSK